MTSQSRSGPPFAASQTARTMELIGSCIEFESDVGTSGARTEESDIDTSSLCAGERWELIFSEGTAIDGAISCGNIGLFPHVHESSGRPLSLSTTLKCLDFRSPSVRQIDGFKRS